MNSFAFSFSGTMDGLSKDVTLLVDDANGDPLDLGELCARFQAFLKGVGYDTGKLTHTIK